MSMLFNNMAKWCKSSPCIGVITIISLFGVLYLMLRSKSEFQNETASKMKHSYCDCYMKPRVFHTTNEDDLTASCAMSGLQGPHQKVISYSFYDDPHTSDKLNRNFFRGINENLEGIKELFNKYLLPHTIHKEVPFTMRLYFQLHPSSMNKDKLCKLACNEPLLDICEIKNSNQIFPMLWRFFPIGDTNVDYFFSRDLDSRITTREIHALLEFINSKKSLHIMRDHMHHGTQILGGMWGVNLQNKNSRERLKTGLYNMLKDPIAFSSRTESQHDQTLLKKYIWPLAGVHGLSHDSYFCQTYKDSIPFPTQRRNGILNFVGAVADINNTIVFTEKNECPYACRPKDHKEWAYC
uniref:Uncharacterized protein n=1 Tax=Lepeophtheirus salmonis TaxID=72036 RepID=A0A0K2TR23_LEPSM